MEQDFDHIPVMPEEVLKFLSPHSGGIYVDGTLGGAGHSMKILEASAPDGRLIGFDRDSSAIAAATARLAGFGDRVTLVHRNFAELEKSLASLEIGSIDGVLLDLGVSSHQLDSAERGFSFRQDAPLDMRMDTGTGPTAADLVNTLPEAELVHIIREYGEERWAGRIAVRIAAAREKSPILTTMALAEIVKGAIPRKFHEERLHPATRTFQALRIAVNAELESLDKGLEAGLRLLKPGGRAVVISFHSLEDRIVKNAFRKLAQGCICPKSIPVCVCGNKPQLRILTGRPVMAGEAELAANPRARSAKLRAAEKL
ncbi:MAG: 16S rRNA (cytosine(1402)-N(4))-methyltransferase RsmH [Geobacter sp.]|nr:16S rRNA (cytosine(1402)-N(4))-methyltransferase RsmH [Geobacter sp.]